MHDKKFKKCVLDAYHNKKLSTREIIDIFQISNSTLFEWINSEKKKFLLKGK